MRILVTDTAYITHQNPRDSTRTYKRRMYGVLLTLLKPRLDSPEMRIKNVAAYGLENNVEEPVGGANNYDKGNMV
jgi:hypothetical protein